MKYYKKSAMFVLRGIAKHNPDMAGILLASGALSGIMSCMEDFDAGVKESAIWAVGYIVKHNINHADAIVSAGAVPLLKLALQEPEVCLRQIAAATLSDIAKHDVTLAQAIIDAGCVSCLVKSLPNPSPKLKKNILCCLSNIAKHSLDMAETIVETDVISDALLYLGHPDLSLRKAAACLVCEIVKHHMQLSQLVVNTGGIGGLLEMISTSDETIILPAILAIGFISSECEQLALAAISSKAVEVLGKILQTNYSDHIKSAVVWTLGQIGKHTPEHVERMSQQHIFLVILKLYTSPESSEDLQQKCKGMFKLVLKKCMNTKALEPLLHLAPPEILKYVIGQFSQILPTNARARRLFVISGSLKKMQEIKAEPGSSLMEYISIVNSCFPEDIIKYYSPGYPDALLDLVDQFVPKVGKDHLRDDDDPEDTELAAELNAPPKKGWQACS
ncbi:sperm-associated antigen 6-like isoform X2 [Halyomorpha halys]|uniref:sperm-associated antigen 6-like isoform X2 n=1 Tax=Halyomorpha halys TaxID=286706 RepID=UPI0006D5156F|nr:sperm-associated antigen 6-like isoform X2 [Halyomorpha halys]